MQKVGVIGAGSRAMSVGAAALAASFIASQRKEEGPLKSFFEGECSVIVNAEPNSMSDDGTRRTTYLVEPTPVLGDVEEIKAGIRDNIAQAVREQGKRAGLGVQQVTGAPTYKASVHGHKGGSNRPMWRASKQGREHHLSLGQKTGISIVQNKGRWATNVHFMGVVVNLPAHANLTICKARSEAKLQEMLKQWADLIDGKHIAEMSAAAAQEEAIKIQL